MRDCQETEPDILGTQMDKIINGPVNDEDRDIGCEPQASEKENTWQQLICCHQGGRRIRTASPGWVGGWVRCM